MSRCLNSWGLCFAVPRQHSDISVLLLLSVSDTTWYSWTDLKQSFYHELSSIGRETGGMSLQRKISKNIKTATVTFDFKRLLSLHRLTFLPILEDEQRMIIYFHYWILGAGSSKLPRLLLMIKPILHIQQTGGLINDYLNCFLCFQLTSMEWKHLYNCPATK